MAFNINSFKANGPEFGGARPAYFEVSFAAPALQNFSTASLKKVSMLVTAAQLPPGNIDSINIHYFGRAIKVAGDRIFTDWTVTCINDEDFAVRALLEAWQNKINALVSNRMDFSSTTLLSYKTDLLVTQFAKNGTKARQYKFVGAFPTIVDAIPLNWEAMNQIETFDCTFAYDYWEPTIQLSGVSDGRTDEYSPQLASDGTALDNFINRS